MWRTSLSVSVVLWWALLTNVDSLPAECAAAPDKACVPKCCPKGHIIQEGGACHKSCAEFRIRLGENATSFADPDTYVIVYGNPCKGRKYPLEPTNNDEAYYLLPNGSLMAPHEFTSPLAPTDFCLEQENGACYIKPFICDEVYGVEKSAFGSGGGKPHMVYPIFRLISVLCLLITVLVYNLIPELGDLNGKTVSSYCSSLAVANSLLACIELGKFSNHVCNTLAYLLQYFLTASFVWLSVLSVDTFWCILVATAATRWVSNYPLLQYKWDDSDKEWKQVKQEVDHYYYWQEIISRAVFVMYSMCAWGFPLILLAAGLKPAVPPSYITSPTHCLFSSEETARLHFYAPIIALMVVISLPLFVFTAHRVLRFNWNGNGDRCIPKHKARMALFVFVPALLICIVGVANVSQEVLNFIDVLQGIIICCIYVLDPRVRSKLAVVWEYYVTNRTVPAVRVENNVEMEALCSPPESGPACIALFVFLLALFISIFKIVSWAVGGEDFAWEQLNTVDVCQGIIIFCMYVPQTRVRSKLTFVIRDCFLQRAVPAGEDGTMDEVVWSDNPFYVAIRQDRPERNTIPYVDTGPDVGSPAPEALRGAGGGQI